MQTILSSVSSVASAACTRLSQSRVVVGARIADEAPNGAQEFVIVAETGVAVRAQSKLELGALLVALVFCEVHEGDVDVLLGSSRRTLVILVPCVVVVLACVSKVIPRGVLPPRKWV